jgi:hypothetical protein
LPLLRALDRRRFDPEHFGLPRGDTKRPDASIWSAVTSAIRAGGAPQAAGLDAASKLSH